MLTTKVCGHLYHHQRTLPRLVILAIITVTLLILEVTFFHVISRRENNHHQNHAKRHIKIDHKSAKTGHEPHLPGQNLTIDYKDVVEKHKLTKDKSIRTTGRKVYADATGQLTAKQAQHAMPMDDLPYQYLINEPDLCSAIPNLYIINLVPTAPQDRKNRTLIRRLWGNELWTHATGFKTVFLLARSKDPNVMADVQAESNLYRDMIQFSFLDSYDNLTVKIVSGLHWVENFCATPVWVLKSDTDMLVNVFLLSRYLHKYDKASNQTRSHFICRITPHSKVCHEEECGNHKWIITRDEYPKETYPPYCIGPAYILPRRLVGPLYHAANKTHPFRIEDVYYTGILPEQLKWDSPHVNIEKRISWKPEKWKWSFVTSDLMILELDFYLGENTTTRVWLTILRNQGTFYSPRTVT